MGICEVSKPLVTYFAIFNGSFDALDSFPPHLNPCAVVIIIICMRKLYYYIYPRTKATGKESEVPLVPVP